MPLFWISLAFLAGICLGNAAPWNSRAWLALSGASLLAFAAAHFLARRFPAHAWLRWAGTAHPALRLAPMLLPVFLFAGAARISASLPDSQAGHIAAWNERGPVSVQAVVISPPDRRDSSTLLQVKAEAVSAAGTPGADRQPAHGLVQVILPAGARVEYGDRLVLTGSLETPPENEGFSYREYLEQQEIYSYLGYPRMRRIERAAASPLLAAIYRSRDWALAEIYRRFPSPEAPLLAGILLGVESGIPLKLARAFQDTGTAHVIAISGFNIAILLGLFSRLFGSFLSRWWAALAAVIAVAGYTMMVGASPSVVRAAIMGSLALAAVELGRRATGYNSLLLSAALMTLFQPHLPWAASFQLSFAATLGLIVFGERFQTGLDGLLARRLPANAVRAVSQPVGEYFLMTLAAQLMTLPIILYHFGRLSLSSLLANPLILPVQPMLMILSGLAVLSGLVAGPLANLLAWLAWPLPAYTIRVVEWFAALPAGMLVLGDVSIGAVALMYAAIAAPGLAKRYPTAKRLVTPGLLLGCTALAAVAAWHGAFTRPDGRLHLTVFNIDGSQVVLLRGPGGQNLLINGGPSARQLGDALGRRLSPFDHNLDALVLSSARASDVNALPTVLERYPTRLALWGSPPDTRAAEKLVEYLKYNQASTHVLAPGESLAVAPGIRLEVAAVSGDSAALLLQWDHFRVLIPAGIPPGDLQDVELLNLSLVLLTSTDLETTSQADWIQSAPQAVVFTPGTGELPPEGTGWISIRPGGWVHASTDGERMWLEEK